MARRSNSAVVSLPDEKDPNEGLTLSELCAELKISPSTFYDWRAKKKAPRCVRLPNGQLRVVRRDLNAWLATREAE